MYVMFSQAIQQLSVDVDQVTAALDSYIDSMSYWVPLVPILS